MKWLIIIAVYFGVGLFFMLCTIARYEIILAVRQAANHRSPAWIKVLAWALMIGISLLGWPVLLKGWFIKAKNFLGIFPCGEAYQALKQRMRVMDGFCREMDGRSPDPVLRQTEGSKVETDTNQYEDKAIKNRGLCKQITVEEAELENMVKTDRLGPNPVPFGFIHGQWLHFKGLIREGDQLWTFCSSGDSWENLAGSEGLCIVRNGKVVANIITRMN